jgi:NAD(P)-dependent dehydrogenase (short-subunit alcohol dehydrogenase family)
MSPRGWALVTGAGRRIGQALALRAAELGHDVLVHARHDADAVETVEAIRAAGAEALAIAGDLADPATPQRLIGAAPAPLSLLVNCASVFEDDRIGGVTAQALDRAHAVNLRAPVLLSQAFAAQAPAGSLIVNLLDQRVLRLDPRYFSYSVSRAALWGATVMLAQALAPDVRVNAIGPGPTLASVHQSAQEFAVEAAATLLRRRIEPQEIADALAYLVGARSVTGQLIAVDAGQHLAWEAPDVTRR